MDTKWMMCRFATTLPHLKSKMPILSGDQIAIIFYQFCHFGNTTWVPLYVKESLYAYRQLLRNTTLASCGKVLFFVDVKAKSVVESQFRDVGLLDIVEWVDVGEYQNMAAYISFFNRVKARYVFQFDSDMWFVRGSPNVKPFDFKNFVSCLNTASDTAIFGEEKDYYEERIWDGMQYYYRYPMLNRQVRDRMRILFDGDDIPPRPRRGIVGIVSGIRKESVAAQKLHAFYEEHGDTFLDDEAFWSVFLTSFRDISVFDTLKQGELLRESFRGGKAQEGAARLVHVGGRNFNRGDGAFDESATLHLRRRLK